MDQGTWQLSVDPRESPELTRALGQLVGLDSGQLKSKGPVWNVVDGKPFPRALPQPAVPEAEIPNFSGSPRVVFKWAKEAFSVNGALFQSPSDPTLLSGTIHAVLPYQGFHASPPGHSLNSMNELPWDVERLALVDVEALQLPPLYRAKLEKAWKQWEFFPLQRLGKVVGPSLLYARWRGTDFVALQLRSAKEAHKAIEQRFPSSVVKRDITRSYGTKIQGYNPDGPAWFVRGDTLVANREGGTGPLVDMLKARFGPGSEERKETDLRREIERLAGTQAGWHICLIDRSQKVPFSWAVLLRWPVSRSTLVTGYVIVDLDDRTK